jgi:Zn-dependent protease
MKLAVKCQYCNKEVALPFKCPFCNQYHCSEHRLPENHKCPEHWRAKAPREQPPTIVVGEAETAPFKYTVSYTPSPISGSFRFSPKELKHLTIGALLVIGVGLSYIPHIPQIARALSSPVLTTELLLSLALIFTFSFLLHEIAHKLSAQHFGLWAEFRLTPFGALITLISMLLPFFKIISPGAVMIAGPITKKKAGKTALAGPLTNIVLSIICVTVYMITQDSFLLINSFFGAWINAIISLFNLIPFGIMDGFKVFQWNKPVWIVAFIASVALTIFAFTS